MQKQQKNHLLRPVRFPKFGRVLDCLLVLGLLFIGAMSPGIGAARGDAITDVTNMQAGGYGGLYIGNRAPLEPSPLLRLPPGSIQPQGWLLTMLQSQSNGLNGLQEQISPFLHFSTSDWTTTNGSGTTQGWERVPYWLRGYIDMGYCLQSPAIISNSSRWVAGVMRSARTNGYFGPAAHFGLSDRQHESDSNAVERALFAQRFLYECQRYRPGHERRAGAGQFQRHHHSAHDVVESSGHTGVGGRGFHRLVPVGPGFGLLV